MFSLEKINKGLEKEGETFPRVSLPLTWLGPLTCPKHHSLQMMCAYSGGNNYLTVIERGLAEVFSFQLLQNEITCSLNRSKQVS